MLELKEQTGKFFGIDNIVFSDIIFTLTFFAQLRREIKMKKIITALLILCMMLGLAACGGSDTEAKDPAPTPAQPVDENDTVTPEVVEPSAEPTPEPTPEPFAEAGKVLLDNEYVTITLEDEIEESYYVGYKMVIENKSDKYVLVTTDNTCIDGYMIYMNIQGASVNPGMKSKAELQVYTSDESSMIKSCMDLKNITGIFSLSFNTDGGNSYTGSNEKYPFSIDGRQNGGVASPEFTGQQILDNDIVRITLGDSIVEDYRVGYKVLIENKTDKYILVTTDNTSVDGFMVYVDIQNSSVAPNAKSVGELLVYTSSSDITGIDQFVNVKGSFRISTNTDGGNSYSGSGAGYTFEFADGSAPGAASAPAEEEPAEEEPAEEVSAQKSEGKEKTLVLGETLVFDDFEFTVNNVELTYELKPSNTNGVYSSFPAESGKVYIHIDGEFYNKSKRDVCIRDLPVPHADYDDGYCYDGFVVVDDGDNSFDWVSSYVVAEPLTTCHYHGLVECPEVIDETDAPLFVTIDLDGVTYRFDIR